MKVRDLQYLVVYVIIFLLTLVTDWYRPLVITIFSFTLFFTIEKMGRAIILRELISLHFIFICLFMPMIGYVYFNQSSLLARVWMRYMFIPESDYFNFALPATTGFVMVLSWPLTNKVLNDYSEGLMPILEKSRKIVAKMKYMGPLLLGLGILMYTISGYLPVQLQFAFQLFYFASFAGFLYVYYESSFKYRNLIIAAFTIYVIIQSLSSAMFTIVAYMGITLSSFLFLNRAISIFRKISFLVLGLFLLFLIQSIKLEYRKAVWDADYSGSKIGLYAELMANRVVTLGDIEPEKVFFPIYYRTNQGFNIALVINRFPRIVEYDKGEKLIIVVASSFVPRFLWPNKPEAGGKENMLYYAGVKIRGFSTNVGPLGEAYGSFGNVGGVIYVMFLALLIRWAYSKVFVIAQKLPLIVFWIPVLFFQISYSAESDTLQILNSLIKSALFIWILYRLFPVLFGSQIKPEMQKHDR